MHKNFGFHRYTIRKRADVVLEEDDGFNHDKYPKYCTELADKGYESATEFLRVIHPRRKPEHRFIRREEEELNKEVS